jgi:hypothetical protein
LSGVHIYYPLSRKTIFILTYDYSVRGVRITPNSEPKFLTDLGRFYT